jgi:predicted Zn finger-like uncharacterized protein
VPIRARCPSCQTEYTLVDSLRGKYVRCERCHQSFKANPVQQGRDTEAVALTDLPPMELTPPAASGLPITIVNTAEDPVRNVERPSQSRPARAPTSGGGGGAAKAGLPIGVIFVAFMALRACTGISNMSSRNEPRWEAPKLPRETIDFRAFKDKAIVPVPNQAKDAKQPEGVPPWFPGNDPWLPGNQKEKAAAPEKR